MKKIIVYGLAFVFMLTLCACSNTDDFADIPPYNDSNADDYSNTDDFSNTSQKLSDTCDYVLRSGTDTFGNYFELVANQRESSLGYEITVGVIKNNRWLYPLSADFPFLWEDGLFHVTVPMGRESGHDLSHYKMIIENIYFIDSGAFAMESYNSRSVTGLKSYDHTMIFFSCSNLESYTVDVEKVHTKYRYRYSDYDRTIYTENGKILLYSETSGRPYGWTDSCEFDWHLLDVQSLKMETFANDIVGIYPRSCLSEGLFFASDQCFYNTNAQKVIDLSAYDIDMFYDGGIYFQDGICTFKAENSLGTEFLITIDKSGNVLEEVQQ